MRARLTDPKLKKMRAPSAGRTEIFDTVRVGLCFRMTSMGARSFSHVYRHAGQLRRDTIGPYPRITLAEARQRVGHAQELLERGTDPRAEAANAEAAERDRLADTVEAVVEEFIKRQAAQVRWPELERVLRKEVVPVWRSRPISEVRKRDVIMLVDAIADRGAPVMANRTLAIIKRFFKWLVSRDVIDASPAATVAQPTKEAKRERVLSEPEIAALWRAATADGWPHGEIVKLLLLTAQRRQEIAGLRWAEIDTVAATIEIPASRYKGKRTHVVPLSAPALAIIANLPHIGESGFVFPSGRAKDHPLTGYSRGKVRLDQFMLEELRRTAAEPAKVTLLPWTMHDLRRTGRTEMSRIGVDKDSAERVLGHALDDLRGRYDKFEYLPQKRAALDRLAAHLMGIVNPPDATKVVKLRGR